MATKAEAEIVQRFGNRYRLCCAPPMMAAELDALGTDFGSTGYTTRAQADDLIERLHLDARDRVADIGSGSGWPGLYLASTTGCRVVGTDLPLEGLRRARDRIVADGIAGRAGCVQATGNRQPFRAGAFDAVIHTDVLCCLTPKLSVLRECRRLLRIGGTLAFTTIFAAPGLTAPQRRRAHRAGPIYVAARHPYPELVERAGFTRLTEVDLTEDYERTQADWYEALEQRADELRRLTSDTEYASNQADRRRTLVAIHDGLLRRSLFTAVRT